MVSAATRKSLLQARVMDFLTSTAILPLLFGCVGVFSLLKLLQWLRMKAYIRDAVVVITGATSGLGRECARVFYAAGAKLVLCGRNAKALEELTEELAASQATKVQTHRPCSVTFDLSDPGCIVGAATEILRCFGHVDVLINNAGVGYRGAIVDTSTDVDRRVMEINYFGPVALTKALLPSMVRRRQGHVVAISSIQGRIGIPFRSACEYFLHLLHVSADFLRMKQHICCPASGAGCLGAEPSSTPHATCDLGQRSIRAVPSPRLQGSSLGGAARRGLTGSVSVSAGPQWTRQAGLSVGLGASGQGRAAVFVRPWVWPHRVLFSHCDCTWHPCWSSTCDEQAGPSADPRVPSPTSPYSGARGRVLAA
nr:dehydrogenase/reductase SDR family member 7B isoform X3 [Vicugna pacos]